MRPDNEITYKGRTWTYIYLDTPGFFVLSPEDHHQIMERMLEMHIDRKRRTEVRGDHFEGVVYTFGERGSVGSFTGQTYYGEFETERGKWKLSILAEPADGYGASLLPAGSRN